MLPGNLDVAILIPCHNEEMAIAAVVRDFRAQLPEARIFIFDNNSSDDTVRVASEAGAIVRFESEQGKGNVVRRMFADVDADVYVLVDGDGTYDAAAVCPALELMLESGLDVVNIARESDSQGSYRRGHRFGNQLLTGMVRAIFGPRFSDMLSGYKVLSRRFVKSFPALARGFETETELAVHALELGMPVGEIRAHYRERTPGSSSKLRTVRDGLLILVTIAKLVRDEKPLAFFSGWAALFTILALVLAWPLALTYMATGLVPRLPTAILCTGLVILACLSLTCGLILDTVSRGRHEMKRLAYLALPAADHALSQRAQRADRTIHVIDPD